MQEIKDMVAKARKAQAIYEQQFDQEDVDKVIKLAARTIFENAEELAELTIAETEMGVYADKVSKNKNKAKGV
ncbi:succinate-semialdehyde dehydrogenase, partial [Odoribacter sp. OttesenSCG-928-G04]|nr:succinate-semialdehyde dehydrogenase [Odoribacter sp. OttesenSCG-928-G04]